MGSTGGMRRAEANFGILSGVLLRAEQDEAIWQDLCAEAIAASTAVRPSPGR